MSEILLKPYPSGFLGSSLVPQTEPMISEAAITFVNHIFNRAQNVKRSPYTASIEASGVWNDVILSRDEFNTFEFKEATLKCALNAFGTETLSQWMSVQAASPDFTATHHNFLDETFKFIYLGTRREYSYHNWLCLLVADNKDYNTKQYTKVQQDILTSKDANGKVIANKTINEFIIDWVRAKNGITDLAACMFILFGYRA